MRTKKQCRGLRSQQDRGMVRSMAGTHGIDGYNAEFSGSFAAAIVNVVNSRRTRGSVRKYFDGYDVYPVHDDGMRLAYRVVAWDDGRASMLEFLLQARIDRPEWIISFEWQTNGRVMKAQGQSVLK